MPHHCCPPHATDCVSLEQLAEVTGRDAAFHLFSRSYLLDNGGTNVQSAIIRHDFEPHELGPPRLNPSNKIQRTQAFLTSDVSMMSKAMDTFEGVRKYVDGLEPVWDTSDLVLADDFMVDTYWGGWMTLDEMKADSAAYRQRTLSGDNDLGGREHRCVRARSFIRGTRRTTLRICDTDTSLVR